MSLTLLRELTVLSAIRSHPAHGYAIAEGLSSSIGWSLGLTKPTVYAVLRRFEDRGWIEGKPVQDTRYPERIEYVVTAEGETAYPVLLSDAVNADLEPVSPLAALLLHLDDLPTADKQRVLEKARRKRTELLISAEDLAAHDGTAAIGLQMMNAQLQQEIDYIDIAMSVPTETVDSN